MRQVVHHPLACLQSQSGELLRQVHQSGCLRADVEIAQHLPRLLPVSLVVVGQHQHALANQTLHGEAQSSYFSSFVQSALCAAWPPSQSKNPRKAPSRLGRRSRCQRTAEATAICQSLTTHKESPNQARNY